MWLIIVYTNSFLRGLRRKAFRGGLWYKALDRFDRSFYNLVCYVVDRVESPVLGKQILSLVLKLRDALKSKFVRLSESFGVRKAWEAVRYAEAWGNKNACAWKYDLGFTRFHAMVEINSASGW